MRAWFATLGVVAQMAFRNLFASRLKTIIVGGIIFFGGAAGGGRQLAARQRGRLDEPQRDRQRRRPHPGLQRQVQGRAGGDGADDDGRSGPRAARRLRQGAGLAAEVPTSSRWSPWGSAARWSPRATPSISCSRSCATPSRRGRDAKRDADGRGPRRRSRPEGARPADRQRAAGRAEERQGDARREGDRSGRRPGGHAARPPTSSGRTSTRTPSTALEFLENRIASQAADADLLYLRYVGTDIEAFQKSFDRMKIVDGTIVPAGNRGFLFAKQVYEDQLKLKAARRLDKIKEGLTGRARRSRTIPISSAWSARTPRRCARSCCSSTRRRPTDIRGQAPG